MLHEFKFIEKGKEFVIYGSDKFFEQVDDAIRLELEKIVNKDDNDNENK